MAESENKVWPAHKSVDELVAFFETTDLGDYLDQMPEAHFDIELEKKTHLIPLEEEMWKQVTRIAKAQQISSAALIQSWLREKIEQAA